MYKSQLFRSCRRNPAGTPPEVWLARFAERELNLKLSPEALEGAKLAVERGRLDLGELSLDPN